MNISPRRSSLPISALLNRTNVDPIDGREEKGQQWDTTSKSPTFHQIFFNTTSSSSSSSPPRAQNPSSKSPNSIIPRACAQSRVSKSVTTGMKPLLKPRQCSQVGLKGPWKPSETALLVSLVRKHGAGNWQRLSKSIPGRTGKQCRERWKNHLDPNLKKGGWTAEEDAIIHRLFAEYGKKWSTIARQLPGRSDNDVKNRYNGALTDRKHRPSSGQNTRAQTMLNERRKRNAVHRTPVLEFDVLGQSVMERPSIFNLF